MFRKIFLLIPVILVLCVKMVSAETYDKVLKVGTHLPANKHNFTSLTPALDYAVGLLSKGKSVKVIIYGGVYEEPYQLLVDKNNTKLQNTPLCIEAAENETVIISGLKGDGFEAPTWTKVEGDANIYSHSWNYNYGVEQGFWADFFGTYPSGIGFRREMLVLDNQVLKDEVLDKYIWVDEDGPKREGSSGNWKTNNKGHVKYQGVVEGELACLSEAFTFAVCDHPEAPSHLKNRIFMRLPNGKVPSDYESIKVSKLLNKDINFEALLYITNKHNLTLKNLKFKYAGTWLVGSSVWLSACNNLRIQNCEVTHNNGAGCIVKGEKVYIDNCQFSYNGGKGFGGEWIAGQQDEMEFVNTQFCFNAHRVRESDFIDFDAAGIKISWANNVKFTKCIAVGNQASGFWHDISCSNIIYDRCFAYGNSLSGFFFELSNISDPKKGYDIATKCISAYNHREGFLMGDVNNPSIKNCLVVNNWQHQIRYRNMRTRKPTLSSEIDSVSIVGCILVSGDRYKQMINFDYAEEILPTAYLRNNQYYSVSRYDKFSAGSNSKSFTGWQELLPNKDANDYQSTYSRISYTPYWFSFVEGTMLFQWAQKNDVPVPYDLIEEYEGLEFKYIGR